MDPCVPLLPLKWSVVLPLHGGVSFHSFADPKGRPGIYDVVSCLEFQGCHLIPLSICFLVILPSPVLYSSFSAFGPFSFPVFQKFLKHFFLEMSNK